MRPAAALVLAATALALAGCGAAVHPGQRIPGRKLTIYFSGPLHGASSAAARSALDGARLALADAGGTIGRYRIVLKVLDDSTYASDGWDPNQTTLDVRQAVQDPTTAGYLGDFNSGASAISIPLLNHAGIAQISSGSTAVGLTTAGIGAAPGEPQKYYPTGVRTFARVLPTDAVQALAIVQAERAVGCASTLVLDDGEVDGEDAALTFLLTAKSAGLRVVGVPLPFIRQAASYISLARSAASSGADCVLISAIDERSSARLTEQLAQALPGATIFAGNGLADSAYIDALPQSLDGRVIVVSAMLPPSSGRERAFLARYAARFGAPEPQAIFGAAAMQLMLDVIDDATHGGRIEADRAKIRDALFDGDERRTVLGMLELDRAGDTRGRFGIYRLAGAKLRFMGAAG